MFRRNNIYRRGRGGGGRSIISLERVVREGFVVVSVNIEMGKRVVGIKRGRDFFKGSWRRF